MVAVKPAGLLLMLGGVWVLCQVLGGDALKRLGVTGKAVDDPASGGRLGGGIDVPHPDDGYGDGYRDGKGNPL